MVVDVELHRRGVPKRGNEVRRLASHQTLWSLKQRIGRTWYMAQGSMTTKKSNAVTGASVRRHANNGFAPSSKTMAKRRKCTYFSTIVKGSRSFALTPSEEHTLSRVDGEWEPRTRLDLRDTFSLPFAMTDSPSRGLSTPDEGVLFNCGR